MTSVQRKEYQQTQVTRTVSPVRNGRSTSTQNLSAFDNNLDNLLEDLQSSVSRPGSSLGNTTTYKETSKVVNGFDSSRSNSLNRVTNLKAANPVTEYSSDDAYSYTSPDGKKSVSSYKKESYSYKTGKDGNISQLDSLLDDLQQVKSFGKESYNNFGADPGFKDKTSSKKSSLQRGDSLRSSTRSRTDHYSSSEGAPSPTPSNTSTLSKQTKATNIRSYPLEVTESPAPDIDPDILAQVDPHLNPPLDGNTKVTTTIKTYTYELPGSGDTSTLDKILSSKKTYEKEYHFEDVPITTSRSRTLERSEKESSLKRDFQYSTNEGTYGDIRTVRHSSPSPSNTSTLTKQSKVTNMQSYPTEVIETTSPEINAEVLAQLDPELHPKGNTKVTTTIKTYTYEIPGSADTTTTSEQYHYSAFDQSQTTPSKSFTYNKAEKAASEILDRYKEDARREYNREEKFYQEYSSSSVPPYQKPASPLLTDRTILKETVTTRNYQPPGRPKYVYDETTTVRNYDQNKEPNQWAPERDGYPVYNPPLHKDTYVTKQTQTTNVEYPQPANQTVVYKETTTNNYSRGDSNRGYPKKDVEVFDPHRPPHAGAKPNEPVNITYKYQSHSSTTNNIKGGFPPKDESEPLLGRPFPRDDYEGPPKRVDELMATIGGEPPDSPLNASFKVHEQELLQQKKVEVIKQQHENEVQKKELPKTKNVTGPPVYYPPGEMFAKKEESGAWRAEGGMAKEKGKYKYKSEEKSKQKGGSGAAIVPVCLPLCCGLPCTII